MPAWPHALLFDFDGVIVHSEPVHCAAFRQLASEENIELSEAEYYKTLIGFDDRGAVTALLKNSGRPLDPPTVRRLMIRKADIAREMLQAGDYHALPGVDQFVRTMSKRYPLAICSGANRDEIELMLKGIGLEGFFKTIVAAEDVEVGKPDPRGYLLTIKQLSEITGQPLTPADCLVIEDAPTVIESVKSVGFKAMGIATSYPLKDLAHADYAAKSLQPADLRTVLPHLAIDA